MLTPASSRPVLPVGLAPPWSLFSTLIFLCHVLTCFSAGPALDAAEPSEIVPLKLDLRRAHHLRVKEVGEGAVELTTLGEDPFIELESFDPAHVPDSHTILAFEYFSPQPVEGLAVYYGPPFQATKQFAAGRLGRAESWLPHAIDLAHLSGGAWTRKSHRLRLDFGRRAGVTLRIRRLHLRAPNLEERRSQAEREAVRRGKLEREARVQGFYAMEYPDEIVSVAIDREAVRLQGRIGEGAGEVRLIEIRPEISVANPGSLVTDHVELASAPGIIDLERILPAGDFAVRLSRRSGSVDRTTSRWALAERLEEGRWRLRSAWRYATDLSSAAANDLPRRVPGGLKGLGGVRAGLPLEELLELGVKNITINMPLSHLLVVGSREGWIPFEHDGQSWSVHPGSISRHDELARFAREHDIVTSAILLVNFSSSEFGKRLVHPEADRAGHYAMPNFTTAEGVAAYEAVIEFLARRYSAPGAPHGRIDNWIIHNEVGYGWEWTNMGRQPPGVYMDHYLRSMRLVHDVTRRHDPHSRVFISLTHHWNHPGDPSWKSYRNLDLLERLIESSRVEGDFAWGVAYHPYPQSLRRADTWNDDRVTDDFDTPLITPKNLQVLDRWMRLPRMRDSGGRIRGLLLSEQGFNTPDYSERSQKIQAAAFVYTWRKMRELDTIEAFHNHRWIDAAGEGGLLLGIRKLPSGGRPFGDPKLAWRVFRALDTPREKEVVRELGLDEVIGSR